MMIFLESQYYSGFNLLLALLGIVVLVGGAIITLMATRRTTVSSIQILRAEGAEALVKTREQELVDCHKKCDKCSEELEDTVTELRGQMGLNVSELMTYWQTRNRTLATVADLKAQIRVLEIRLGDRKE